MSTPVSYQPDVPPPLALAQRLNIAGDMVMLVIYGLSVAVFLECFQVLMKLLRSPAGNTAAKRMQLVHACAIFICGTLFVSAELWANLTATLNFPLYPNGGALSWLNDNYNNPIVMLGNSMFEITTWLADAFMLYRCYVVYTMTTGVWYILLLPGLLYLASISMGILLLIQVSHPLSTLFSNVNFGLASFSINASLNIVITLLISARLITHRLRMQKVMGRGTEARSLNMYTSITTILVESSAIYSAAFLMFIVPFAMQNVAAKFFLPILALVQVISPLLVSLRLAKEMAWTAGTTKEMSTFQVQEGSMRFKSRNGTLNSPSATNFSSSQNAVEISLETRKDYGYTDTKV